MTNAFWACLPFNFLLHSGATVPRVQCFNDLITIFCHIWVHLSAFMYSIEHIE